MERVMKTCPQCTGDGKCHPCKGSGRSGYFLTAPGPDAKPCPHCIGSGRCRGCEGGGQVVDWSRSFSPCISVLTSEQVPRSISCAAITGAGWRSLPIPEAVQEQSHEAQLFWVSERVREHYQESNGRIPLFGSITGYSWRYARGQSSRFDTLGRPQEES